jgi:uncharacterized protein
MTVYAESSAVLAWLLEQAQGETVAETLMQATLIVASDLTLIECDRVIVRAVVLNELRESEAVTRQARLNAVSARWTLFGLDDEIVERARRPFPGEPVRTLDAIHLASALVARKAVPDIAMLSLDHRVRETAGRLGLPLLPDDRTLAPRDEGPGR